MPWTYIQSTGDLADPDGVVAGTGYSGLGPDKNVPADEAVEGHGPIPVGEYTIAPSITSPKLGPLAMALIPASSNKMFGRSGFFIHGDSIASPGNASEGCIILAHSVRVLVDASADRTLIVRED